MMKKRQLIGWKTYLVILGVFSMVQVFARPSNNIMSLLKGRTQGLEMKCFTSNDENKPQVQKDNLVLGKVIDESTGEPINGAKVLIGSHDGINEDQYHTNEDGLFLVDCDQSKKYVALAAKSSYSNESLFFTPPTVGLRDTLIIKLRKV